MAFYKPNGDIFKNTEDFIDFYEPCYFGEGPHCVRKLANNCGRRIYSSSRFSEKEIERILKSGIQSEEDVKIILAWKTGKIIHKKTEEKKSFVFYDKWPEKGSGELPNLDDITYNIVKDIESLDKKTTGDIRKYLEGFDHIGPVYAQTLLYFISKGKYPIYDKCAQIALKAYEENIFPGNAVKYEELPPDNPEKADKIINNYTCLIRKAFSLNGTELDTIVKKYRKIDRALWVYGHCFTNDSDSSDCC